MIDRNGAIGLFLAGVVLAVLLAAFMGSAGCLRSAAGTAYQMIAPAAEPVPVPEPVAIPTTIPAENISQPVVYREPLSEWMYRTGGRWMGENFTWIRNDVSGLKDMKVRTFVYDYRILYGYEWWSVSWGRYFYQVPTSGKKFLVLQVYMEMIGENQTWDPRMYGMGQDHWYLQADGSILTPDPNYVPCIRIRELEEVWNCRHVESVQSYGYYRNSQLGVETCEDLGYLRMGESNSWDGYLIYEIPLETNPADLMVLFRGDGFGNAWWYLKENPNETGNDNGNPCRSG